METAADFTQPVPVFQQLPDIRPGQAHAYRAGLAAMVGIPPLVEGNSGGEGNVAVARAVDDEAGFDSLRPLFGLDYDGPDAAVPDHHVVDEGVQLDVHAFPAEKIIQVYLQKLAVEAVGGVGPQVVGGIFTVKAFLHFPGDSLGSEGRAFHKVIAGFHIAGGYIAAQESPFLQQHGLHAHTGGCRGGSRAGGPAAHYQDIHALAERDTFLRNRDIHCVLPPL